MASTARKQPLDIDAHHLCEICKSYLPKQEAKGGQAPGTWYICCQKCKFFYRWEPGVVPTQPPPSATTSTSSNSAGPAKRGSSPQCSSDRCSKPAHRTCSNAMCRSCCVVCKGGCATPGHSVQRLSQKQRINAGLVSPVSTSTPAVPIPMASMPSFTTKIRETLNDPQQYPHLSPTSRYMRVHDSIHSQLEAETIREHQLEAEKEAEEDAAYAQLIDKTRASLRSPTPSCPVSPHVSVVIDPSDLPRGILSPEPPTTDPSRSSAPLVAPSSLNRPITTQLNATWMGTAPSPPTTGITPKDRRLAELKAKRLFTVILWLKDGDLPRTYHLHDPPSWPYWSFDDLPDASNHHEIQLEMFDFKSHWWFVTQRDYPHKLEPSKNTHILLRRQGVTDCHRLNYWIAKSENRPAHLFSNTKSERQSVVQKLKTHIPQSVIELSDSDDDDNDDSLLPSVSALLKSTLTKDTAQSTQAVHTTSSQRDDMAPLLSPLLLKGRVTSPSSSPSPSQTPTLSSSPVISASSSATVLDASDYPVTMLPAEVVKSSKPWPMGWYTSDIAIGFAAMDKMRRDTPHHPVGHCFTKVFGREFKKTTYFTNRRYWDDSNVSQVTRDFYVAQGHTVTGTWSKFVAGRLDNPL